MNRRLRKFKKTILRGFAKVKNDDNHWRRRSIGIVLIICGLIGPFVPVLGLWMLPLGVILLIADREWYRKLNHKLRHRRRRRRSRKKDKKQKK